MSSAALRVWRQVGKPVVKPVKVKRQVGKSKKKGGGEA
jgi:hypothetical protein